MEQVSENGLDVEHTKSDLVEVDRKISLLEWFMILTGPFIMPIYGPFILLFACKTYLAKQRGQRANALHNKAMLVGLGQWAYRTSLTFCCFGIVIFVMVKTERF